MNNWIDIDVLKPKKSDAAYWVEDERGNVFVAERYEDGVFFLGTWDSSMDKIVAYIEIPKPYHRLIPRGQPTFRQGIMKDQAIMRINDIKEGRQIDHLRRSINPADRFAAADGATRELMAIFDIEEGEL